MIEKEKYFARVPVGLIRDPELNSIALRIYCLISSMDGCRMSHEKLGAIIGVTFNTFSRHLKILIDKGLVAATPIPNQKTKLYTVSQEAN